MGFVTLCFFDSTMFEVEEIAMNFESGQFEEIEIWRLLKFILIPICYIFFNFGTFLYAIANIFNGFDYIMIGMWIIVAFLSFIKILFSETFFVIINLDTINKVILSLLLTIVFI